MQCYHGGDLPLSVACRALCLLRLPLQVRSSKQDQIHNSIVSTLLALMDGLDARGQVRRRRTASLHTRLPRRTGKACCLRAARHASLGPT